MSEITLSAENISKKFAKSLRQSLKYGAYDIFKEVGNKRSSNKLRKGEFWALKDTSFQLERGDSLGVLGANGAGKTTLLKIVSGLIKPDTGKVTVKGRLERIIALTAGFKTELSGLENIHLRAKLLGYEGKDLDAVVEEIIDFSELGDFIEMPVMNYSSGMKARLGFAVSTAFKPDVLVIDEVLAVGDLRFKLKCHDRIYQIRKDTTVLFVSHSLPNVARICNKACVIEKGQMTYFGDTQEAIKLYQESIGITSKNANVTLNPELISLTLMAPEREVQNGDVLKYDQKLKAMIKFGNIGGSCSFRVLLRDQNGKPLVDWESRRLDFQVEGGSSVEVDLGGLQLNSGNYSISIVVAGEDGETLAISKSILFKLETIYYSGVVFQPKAKFKIIRSDKKQGVELV